MKKTYAQKFASIGGRTRWAKKSKEERSAHMKMMSKSRKLKVSSIDDHEVRFESVDAQIKS